MATYKDYYYESLPNEIHKQTEKDATKANTVGTYTIEWYRGSGMLMAQIPAKMVQDGDWAGDENSKPYSIRSGDICISD